MADYRRSLVRRPGVPDDQRAVRRDRAPARRAVPGRVGRRRHAGPDRRSVRGVGAREGRRHRPRAERDHAGDGPRAAARVRRGGARSRASAARWPATSARTTSATSRRADRWPRSCVRHYLNAEAAPGHRDRSRPRAEIPADDHRRGAGRAGARDDPRRTTAWCIASAPEKAGLAAVTEPMLRDALRAGLTATVTPWRDEMAGRELLAKAPAPGTVQLAPRDSRDRRHGADALERRRGVAEADRLPERSDHLHVVRARRRVARVGGRLHQRVARHLARRASAASAASRPIDLGKLLAGKIANASPSVSSYTQGVSGSSTPKDLETALQLVYLEFTAPNQDPAAFDAAEAAARGEPGQSGAEPRRGVRRARRAASTRWITTRRAPLKLEDLPELDADRMMAFYTAAFRQRRRLHVLLRRRVQGGRGHAAAGDLSRLAAVDAGRATAKLRRHATAVPDQRRPREGDQGPGAAQPDGDDVLRRHRTRRARDASRCRRRPRCSRCGCATSCARSSAAPIRWASATPNTSPQPGYGTTSVQFGSSPENVERLTAAVMTEIERLQKDGPTAADVQAVKEQEKNELAGRRCCRTATG